MSIPSMHPLPVGARVRHYGQQYPEARTGTATIVQVKGPLRDGSYEYKVRTTRPFEIYGPEDHLRWWSSFTTIPAVEEASDAS